MRKLTNDQVRAIAYVLKNYTMYNVGLDISMELALLFGKWHPAFDKVEFLKACSVESSSIH